MVIIIQTPIEVLVILEWMLFVVGPKNLSWAVVSSTD